MLGRILRRIERWALALIEGYPLPIEDVILIEALGHAVTTNGTLVKLVERQRRR